MGFKPTGRSSHNLAQSIPVRSSTWSDVSLHAWLTRPAVGPGIPVAGLAHPGSAGERLLFAGGKIVVYTGIVPVAQNEAALATVMGHEMAHATSRHGAQRVLQQNLTQTAMTGIAVSLSDMDYDKQRAVMGALGAGAQFGILMPFGRKHESEADEIA